MKGIKKHYSFINILTGSDLSKRRLPYMQLKSSNPGPLLVLTGCMHGDEIGGTVIIHELFKKLSLCLIRGSIHAFPVLNPFGLENASRNITLSKEDLNRSFPGNPMGTLAERIAHQIFTFICGLKPDLVLDLHNDWNKSIPYALLENSGTIAINGKNLDYAHASGLLLINENDVIERSLSYNLIRQEIPALTLELGESLTINEKQITYGLDAILNIIARLGMIDVELPRLTYPLPEQLKDMVLSYSHLPLCSSSGIIRFSKKPGDQVRKGEKIARVYNAFGKRIEIINAVGNGIILGHTDYAVTFPGFPVMAFGFTAHGLSR